MRWRPTTLGCLMLLVVSLLGTTSASNAAEEDPCAARGCGAIVGTLENHRRGVSEFISLVDAEDPERVVWRQEVDPEGRWFGGGPPGRYKILLGQGTWWGGVSHATARVVVLKKGERKKLTFDRADGAGVRLEVRDTRYDVPRYLRAIVRDAADPAEVLTSLTVSDGNVLTGVRGGRDLLVEIVDLTGQYRSTTVDLRRQESTLVTLHVASGADPVSTRGQGPLGEIQGFISVDDYEYGRVKAHLFRADRPSGPLMADEVYTPEGRRNLRLRDVTPGRYKIQFTDGLWYGGQSHDSAATIVVEPGATTTITDHVPRRGDVRGKVRSDRGVELNDVLVTAYRTGGDQPVGQVLTGRSLSPPEPGFYFVGLPQGEYQLLVSDTAGRIVPRWVGGGSARTSAATVKPSLGGTLDLGDVTVSTGLRATTTPKISGRAQRGKTLKVGSNQWSIGSVAVKRQWLRDGKPIKGATKSSYKVTKADKGRRLSVRVTGSRSGRPSATITTRQTSRVR